MSVPDVFALGGQSQDQEDIEDAEIAAIEFEPVEDPAKLFAAVSVEWRETTKTVGVDCRIAATILSKTKPELVDMARKLLADDADKTFWEMMERLVDTQNWLVSLTAMMKDAERRLLIAAHVVAVEHDAAGRP